MHLVTWTFYYFRSTPSYVRVIHVHNSTTQSFHNTVFFIEDLPLTTTEADIMRQELTMLQLDMLSMLQEEKNRRSGRKTKKTRCP